MYESAPRRGADTGHTKRDSTTFCGKGWCAEPFTDVIRVYFSPSQQLNRSAAVIEPPANSPEVIHSGVSVNWSVTNAIDVCRRSVIYSIFVRRPSSIKRDAGATSWYVRLGDIINGGKIPCWQQGPLWNGRDGTHPRNTPIAYFFRSGFNRSGGERHFRLLPLPAPAAFEAADQRRAAVVPTACAESALCRTTATTAGVQAV